MPVEDIIRVISSPQTQEPDSDKTYENMAQVVTFCGSEDYFRVADHTGAIARTLEEPESYQRLLPLTAHDVICLNKRRAADGKRPAPKKSGSDA